MIHRLGDLKPQFDTQANFIAANATLIGNVHLAADASVWFGAVIRAENDAIRIGRGSNIQDGAILHTDPGIELEVGDDVTVGHRAMLHGCRIGDGSLIGIGATLLNHSSVGRDCLVGAHALITEGKTFPDGVLIVGAPAQIVRELSDEERAQLRGAAKGYVQQSRRYQRELSPHNPDAG